MKNTTFSFVLKSCLGLIFLIPTVRDCHSQTVTDIDGNVYNTITIGQQIWLQENLKVTHFRNGDSIPKVTIGPFWLITDDPAYCDYGDLSTSGEEYGHLYNFAVAADERNVCPNGWHVASDAEWWELISNTGGLDSAGGHLKEAGTLHWEAPNTGATNSYGFKALPSGMRCASDNCSSGPPVDEAQGLWACWWTSTGPIFDSIAYSIVIEYISAEIHRWNYTTSYGFAIRCISDSVAQGTGPNPDLPRLNLYPNPAHDATYLLMKEPVRYCYISDPTGRKVLECLPDPGSGKIDLTGLPAGIYVLVACGISGDQGIGKLIIE